MIMIISSSSSSSSELEKYTPMALVDNKMANDIVPKA